MIAQFIYFLYIFCIFFVYKKLNFQRLEIIISAKMRVFEDDEFNAIVTALTLAKSDPMVQAVIDKLNKASTRSICDFGKKCTKNDCSRLHPKNWNPNYASKKPESELSEIDKLEAKLNSLKLVSSVKKATPKSDSISDDIQLVKLESSSNAPKDKKKSDDSWRKEKDCRDNSKCENKTCGFKHPSDWQYHKK